MSLVGLTTASRALLTKWKRSASPDQRERLDAMVETASYEAVLHELRGKEEDGLSSWELFHSFTRQTRNRMRHLFPFTLGQYFIVFGLLRLIFHSNFFSSFFMTCHGRTRTHTQGKNNACMMNLHSFHFFCFSVPFVFHVPLKIN